MSPSPNQLKILITNDDGINSEGIKVLAKKLSEVCDVYIMAPAENQSAVSSRISLSRPLEFVKYSDKSFSCSGTPADCVISAFKSSVFSGIKFDAVFSGINHGPNLGTDIIYSGTIAAARQAVLYGTPGIAVSIESPELDYAESNFNFNGVADFCAKNLEQLISLSKNDLLVSINALSSECYNEAVVTGLCRRDYNDYVDIKVKENRRYTGICNGGRISVKGEPDCDYNAVRSGKISVSLIHAHPEAAEYNGNISFNF